MTYKTHKLGGTTTMLVCFPLFLINYMRLEISAIEELYTIVIALILSYTASYWGCIFPDLDANSKEALPFKNLIARRINKTLRKIGCSHRSYHTHCMDIYLIVLGIPSFIFYNLYRLTQNVLYLFMFLVFINFMFSCMVHIFLDMFTTQGANLSLVYIYIKEHTNMKHSKKSLKEIAKSYRITIPPKTLPYITFTKKGILPVPNIVNKQLDLTTGSEYETHFRNVLKSLNGIAFTLIVGVFMYTNLTTQLGLDIKHDTKSNKPKIRMSDKKTLEKANELWKLK